MTTNDYSTVQRIDYDDGITVEWQRTKHDDWCERAEAIYTALEFDRYQIPHVRDTVLEQIQNATHDHDVESVDVDGKRNYRTACIANPADFLITVFDGLKQALESGFMDTDLTDVETRKQYVHAMAPTDHAFNLYFRNR